MEDANSQVEYKEPLSRFKSMSPKKKSLSFYSQWPRLLKPNRICDQNSPYEDVSEAEAGLKNGVMDDDYSQHNERE